MLTDDLAQTYLDQAAENLARSYPWVLLHVMRGHDDIAPPQWQHPAFWGAYDWHSSVHQQWLLVRLLRRGGVEGAAARRVLDERLTVENLALERLYLGERPGFGRPYGWAWLILLHAETVSWDDPAARRWAGALTRLRHLLVSRVEAWLGGLGYPVRHGVHGNTAFSLLLIDGAAALTGDGALHKLIAVEAERLFARDRDAPIAYEPSGEDFVSPSLAQAHLLARTMPRSDWLAWLDGFLPGVQDGDLGTLVTPPEVRDPQDARVGHLIGLGLTRAWHLQALASALPDGHPGAAAAAAAAQDHLDAALPLVLTSGYGGAHWLPTYAVLALEGSGSI